MLRLHLLEPPLLLAGGTAPRLTHALTQSLLLRALHHAAHCTTPELVQRALPKGVQGVTLVCVATNYVGAITTLHTYHSSVPALRLGLCSLLLQVPRVTQSCIHERSKVGWVTSLRSKRGGSRVSSHDQ